MMRGLPLLHQNPARKKASRQHPISSPQTSPESNWSLRPRAIFSFYAKATEIRLVVGLGAAEGRRKMLATRCCRRNTDFPSNIDSLELRCQVERVRRAALQAVQSDK